MQLDFHYYATYCAAILAGYSHEESLKLSYSAQFVDCCSRTLLKKLKAPLSAATTQLQLEMMDARQDAFGLQDITRIWSSFHFLPHDLYAERKGCTKLYRDKYRLICDVNGSLLKETVELAKRENTLQAAGIAMHVLADTWAHRYFAGTPSLVINNTDYHFYEILSENGAEVRRPVMFRHDPTSPDDIISGKYTGSLYTMGETSIMNLGHGRAGHLPDYSCVRYAYLPAWGRYREIIKDNPSDYMNAFRQMVTAMKYLRGEQSDFIPEQMRTDITEPYEEEIRAILTRRQLIASADWKAFGEKLSGKEIPDFRISEYEKEYVSANSDGKDSTFLGKFTIAAMEQKSMVTNRIFSSGNLLAGFSVDFSIAGFRGIADFRKLTERITGEIRKQIIPDSRGTHHNDHEEKGADRK